MTAPMIVRPPGMSASHARAVAVVATSTTATTTWSRRPITTNVVVRARVNRSGIGVISCRGKLLAQLVDAMVVGGDAVGGVGQGGAQLAGLAHQGQPGDHRGHGAAAASEAAAADQAAAT